MLFKECESTWVCQLNKPHNRARLEQFRDMRDKSAGSLADLYQFVIEALRPTQAWGISGVNKMVNKFTDEVKATMSHAKNGKRSSFAKANDLLNTIDRNKNRLTFNMPKQDQDHVYLEALCTEEELDALRNM